MSDEINIYYVITYMGIVITLILLLGIYANHKMVIERSKIDARFSFFESKRKSVNELFADLDFLIEQEFVFSLQIPYEGKEVKKITDFEGVLASLNNGVINAINQFMIDEFEYYGINSEYIYAYITRKNTLFLLTYMKENGIGGSAPKNEEDEE